MSSLSGPLVARMLSFCSSCTNSPQKRLNVRGNRTCMHSTVVAHVCACKSLSIAEESKQANTAGGRPAHLLKIILGDTLQLLTTLLARVLRT